MSFPTRGKFSPFFPQILVLTCWLSLPIFSNPSSSNSEIGLYFVTWPEWKVVGPGSEVVLKCSTTLPPDNITWLHDHRPLPYDYDSSQGPRVMSEGSTESKLFVKISKEQKTYRRQEGLYQCLASLGAIVVASTPGRLQVAYLRAFQREATNYTIKTEIGSAFRVSCQKPQSLPPPVMHFYKNERMLNLYQENRFLLTKSGDLIVMNARVSSRGVYSCAARNEVLNETVISPSSTRVYVKRKSYSRNLGEPPQLTLYETAISTIVGSRERMLCVAENVVESLYWTFEKSKPVQYLTSESTAVMVLRNVSIYDHGVYKCHGKNVFGSSFLDFKLLVQESPYIMETPISKSVAEGGNTSISCVFGGTPIPTVAWLSAGDLLTSNSNRVLDGNVLHFQNIRRNQSGIYQCFGFSHLGAAQGMAIITVIPEIVTETPEVTDGKSNQSLPSTSAEESSSGKGGRKKGRMFSPSKPRITKLSDESVMVTWDAESKEGALPILFFKVQYKTLKVSGKSEELLTPWKTVEEDIPPNEKSLEVTELKAEHVYRFRVAAVYANNDNILGPSSRKFLLTKDLKLKRPSNQPKIISVIPKGNSSVLLVWSYKTLVKTEGFIIAYRETDLASRYTKVTLLGDDRRNYTINFLRPKLPYDFKVCSFNMAGTSQYSKRVTYIPEGISYSSNEARNMQNMEDLVVPVVRSDPEGISSSVLYIALGTGLCMMFFVIILSFLVYSCRQQNAPGEEVVDSKFMDTSLRIHLASTVSQVRPKSYPEDSSSKTDDKHNVPLLTVRMNEILTESNEPYDKSINEDKCQSEHLKENGNSV